MRLGGERGTGSGTEMARRALALRPQPDAAGRMPDPRTRGGMPDLYAYANALGEYKRRNPGRDVMSNLMTYVDDAGGRVSIEEFENLFWLFSVAGNETLRNGIPGGMVALMSNPEDSAISGPTVPCCPPPWRRCCGGGRRSCTSAARRRSTPSSAE